LTDQRSILITGASRGLGFELAKLCLAKGWLTFPLVRDTTAVSPLCERSRHCYPIVADVRFDDCSAKIAAAVSGRTTRLDVLVNNAGSSGKARSIDEVTSQELLELLQVHCLGAVRCTLAALPWLRAAKGAKIVNISSRLASLARNAGGEFAPREFSYSYRIAKAAQNMFTLCLRAELKEQGIAVYAVHPGGLRTAMATAYADTDVDVAAARLLDFIEHADESLTGRLIDLGKGDMPW
jgi:NAD(P)-dependent dehydrogenase (short-subunit alcohol dehydrogenase family)